MYNVHAPKTRLDRHTSMSVPTESTVVDGGQDTQTASTENGSLKNVTTSQTNIISTAYGYLYNVHVRHVR